MILLRFISVFCFVLFLSACGSSRKATTGGGVIMIENTTTEKKGTGYSILQNKYAGYLDVKPDKIGNIPLYQFIDYWLNTPYKWGGTDKRGIDCSAFIQRLLDSVYAINIPRTSVEQFYAQWVDKFKSTAHLSEGDLVFFKTVGDNVVSHVGMYLNNGRFINASSSKGVSIASINDPYWKQRLVGAGRINLNLLPGYKK